jgi:hypothetical protein
MTDKEPHPTKYECYQPHCMKDSPTVPSALLTASKLGKPNLQPCHLIPTKLVTKGKKNDIKMGNHRVEIPSIKGHDTHGLLYVPSKLPITIHIKGHDTHGLLYVPSKLPITIHIQQYSNLLLSFCNTMELCNVMRHRHCIQQPSINQSHHPPS